MPDSRLHQLSALGQSVWIDYLSRDLLALGRARADDGRGRGHRRHLEPDDLPEGDLEGDRLRRPAARPARARGRREGDLHRARRSRDIGEACDLMRTVWDERQRAARLRLDRGRPDARRRHRGDARRGAAPPRADRQAEPLREDPGDEGGPAGDRGDDRRRQVDQRHADLLARAAPRGDGGVHPRASSGSSRRAATRPRSRPSRASSSRASTPRPTSASTRSAATTS